MEQDNPIDLLENQVNHMLNIIERLAHQNDDLTRRMQILESERNELKDRNDIALTQIERMIEKLTELHPDLLSDTSSHRTTQGEEA